MKKLLSILAILVLSACVFAQDIIVTNKAQKIDAKILEVSTSEIKYKELDNLDGPTFILRTEEVNCIIYANGKVALYNQPQERDYVEERKSAEAKAYAMGSLFGNESSDAKGNAVGHGTKGASSWSLSGRGVKGTLPHPSNNFNQEGKVVVQIRVNAAGDVVEAKCIEEGTSVADRHTRQLALDAAMKAKFTKGSSDQIGTITYNFIFN